MCLKEAVDGILACQMFLVNGLQPLWRSRGSHDETDEGEAT
jgi:hypothetical protein